MPPLVFFLISGYFWRDARGETSRERCRRRFVKTLKVTVFWVVAYMLFTTALVYPFHGELPGMDSAGEWLRSFFSADNLVKMVLVQRSPGVGTHLWYMLALTVAQLAMWGLYEIKATRARLPLAVALIAAQIAVQWTFCLKGWNFGAEFLRNAWLTGLPWMLVGDWLRGREESICRIPTALLAAVGVLGLFTAPLEFWRAARRSIRSGCTLPRRRWSCWRSNSARMSIARGRARCVRSRSRCTCGTCCS